MTIKVSQINAVMANTKRGSKPEQMNRARLEGCRGHDFRAPVSGNLAEVTAWRCLRCGGQVDPETRRWYELGFAHGHRHA